MSRHISVYMLLLLCCGIVMTFLLSSKIPFFSHVEPLQWMAAKAGLMSNSGKGTTEEDTEVKHDDGTFLWNYRRNNSTQKYNVLLIIADDMRPDMGCFGGSPFKVYTPNINRLVVLRQAYTQYALCGPSRTTLFTGRRPDTHGLYKNSEVSRSKTNFTNMFAYFKSHGYNTYSIGKTFHYHAASPWLTATDTWSEPPQLPDGTGGTPYWNKTRHLWRSVSQEEREQHPLPDDYTLEASLDRLSQVAKSEHPYFMAVGFVQTHTPIHYLDKFKKHYPLESVTLPNNTRQIRNLPGLGKRHSDKFKCHKIKFNFSTLAEKSCREGQALKVAIFRQAYLSAQSYIDSLMGKLLKELDILNLNDNTIIGFLADHSYMLGENSLWRKDILLDAAARVPLLIHVPGQTDQGIVSDRLVELVDVFPTLVQAAGLPAIPMCPEYGSIRTNLCHEGMDFTPLKRTPNAPWKKAAFTQRSQRVGKTSKYGMAYSARTEQYRYTEYIEYSTRTSLHTLGGTVHARELYDHTAEAPETYNRAGNSSYRPVMNALSQLIHDGWKAALPLGDFTR